MKQWNEKEIKLLIELRNNNFSAPQIAKELNTTMHVVNNKIRQLKLEKKVYWTKEQEVN